MAESMDLIEKRHKQEVRDLEGKVRALMKTAKKSNRAAIETEAIQMGYDLKARHLEELENPSNIEGASNVERRDACRSLRSILSTMLFHFETAYISRLLLSSCL